MDGFTDLERSYAVVRWGRVTESHESWRELQQHVLASMGSAVSHRRGIDKLMRNFRGERIGRDQLVRSLHCSRDEAARWRERVYRPLQMLHKPVFEAFEQRIEWLGVVA